MGQPIVNWPGISEHMAASMRLAPVRPVSSARARLKHATSDAHDRLDALFSAFDLTDPNGYRRFLAVHWQVLPRCEAMLAASGAARLLPDWPARVRTQALAHDLAAVGGQAPAGHGDVAAVGPAAAFGMMYVLEGSRLGGAVLARRVEANDDPACRGATRYLRHGAGQGLWPSFVAALDAAGCVADDITACIAGAARIFALFEAEASLESGRPALHNTP